MLFGLKRPTPTLLVLSSLLALCTAFEIADYVPAARRSQYSGVRTVWHDLLSRHCPRFGEHKVAALPLPEPKGFTPEAESYKIQLSFDGDRHLTAWIRLIGKGPPEVPYLHISLNRRGPALIGVKAQVTAVPSQYLVTHHILVEEFHNVSHWPKHLLIEYSWEQAEAINANAGLYAVFIMGLLVTWILLVNVMVTYKQKLTIFMSDMLAEGRAAGGVAKFD